MQNLEALPAVLIAAAIGLVTKIVWDWLNNRDTPDVMASLPLTHPHCEDHDERNKSIHECMNCLVDVKKKQSAFEERTSHILHELKRGTEKFDSLDQNISEIKASLAGLIALARERSGGLFQKGDIKEWTK